MFVLLPSDPGQATITEIRVEAASTGATLGNIYVEWRVTRIKQYYHGNTHSAVLP